MHPATIAEVGMLFRISPPFADTAKTGDIDRDTVPPYDNPLPGPPPASPPNDPPPPDSPPLQTPQLSAEPVPDLDMDLDNEEEPVISNGTTPGIASVNVGFTYLIEKSENKRE